jgi:chromosomal replication initiation ATPase DnaA
MSTGQLAFDLVWRPALGRDDFLVAPPNCEAVAWIDLWPDWPTRAIVLSGPSGSGKSHLGAVWQARSGAVIIERQALEPGDVAAWLETDSPLLVDDADCASEEPLLHLYNAITERRGSLLLIAERPPSHWQTRLPDLASRLVALPVAIIEPPDDALIRALLIKLFSDRRLTVSAEIVEYLAQRMERSFEAARQLVTRLDSESLASRRPITLRLAREILHQLEAD